MNEFIRYLHGIYTDNDRITQTMCMTQYTDFNSLKTKGE
jgi:hypothetical protein